MTNEIMKGKIKSISLALLTFVLASTIAGQILMCGQGDTPEISHWYGLLYVAYGCGIPQTIKGLFAGELPLSLVFAVLAQTVASVTVFFWSERRKML